MLRAVLVIASAVGAASAASGIGAEAAPTAGFYEGSLPCADCSGVRYRLQLRSDQLFVLARDYLGKPVGEGNPRNVLGLWSQSADGLTIELRDAGEAPALFTVPAPGVLRKLDNEGRAIGASRNYELLRQEPGAPFEPLLRLQGLYANTAGAGVFRECLSRQTFSVDGTGDGDALAHAYAAARHEQGEELLVTVDGRIAAPAGGTQPEELSIERFIGIWPGETCGHPLATAQLIDTYWKLTRLGDHPVLVGPGAREPHLILKAAGAEIDGFGGCNGFMGTFRQEGNTLNLGRIAATMVPCDEGMEQEQEFFRALQATVRWSILGEHLELYDKDGKLRARFEARYKK